jgi:hypothetical protein
MSLDDFMFAMIIAGAVLSGAHLCISFRRWRFDNAAALRRELTYRHLHADRLSASTKMLQTQASQSRRASQVQDPTKLSGSAFQLALQMPRELGDGRMLE